MIINYLQRKNEMPQHGINSQQEQEELVSYLDFCIDLETLNTNRLHPCIIQCGVVASLTNTRLVQHEPSQMELVQQLDTKIVLVEQFFPRYPMYLVETDTHNWWKHEDRHWLLEWIRGQVDSADLSRRAFLTSLAASMIGTVKQAQKVADSLGSKLVTKVWANSPTFDLTMLEAEYKSIGIPTPWSYKEEMDIRTIRSLLVCPSHHREILAEQLATHKPELDKGYLVPHNAVYDAYAELLDVLWVRATLWEAGL